MTRDSFVFYRSFAEVVRELPTDKDKLLLLSSIINYSLEGIEPELTGILKGIFILIKPQIDANNKKYENGKKGGRPATATLDERLEEALKERNKTKK